MNLIYGNTEYARTEVMRFPISKNVQKLSYNKKSSLPPSEFDNPEDIEDGWFEVKNNAIP